VRHAQEKLPQASADSRWIILPRMRWLSPARLAADASVMTYAALDSKLNQHFNSSNEAVLVFELTRAATGGWHEKSRGFVVCSTWPAIDGILNT
jgi:hypothetical protein